VWTSSCGLTAAAFFWQVTHKVNNIPADHKDLLTWSCHSISVTVTNLLHHATFSDSYIKNRLCWCCNTFLMYLGNTSYTADQHTNAIMLGLDPPSRGLARPLEPHKTLLCTGAT
jgi:hypothetical protein